MASLRSWGLSSATVMDWRVGAACRKSHMPDAWIVNNAKPSPANQTALRICRSCPVMQECDAWYAELAPELRQSVIAGGKRYTAYGYPDEPRPKVAFPPGVYTSGEVARVLEVSRNTISTWCANGRLVADRDERGFWVIDGEDVNRCLEQEVP